MSLAPVAASFVVFGAFWGGWAVAAADIQETLGVSHGGYGILLSVALAGAAAANAVGGALAERIGTARLLSGALAAWGVLLVASSATSHRAALVALIVVMVAAGGLVDVTMNVAATAALATQPGRLVRFHATFNGGAAVGAATVGLLVANQLSWRWHFVAAGAAALVLAGVTRRATLPAHGAGEPIALTGAVRLLRRDGLGLIAVAFAVGAMVEGGVELWGVLFLRLHLEAGMLVGAGSAALGYGIAAVARIVVGPLASRRGAARGSSAGATAAAAGTVLLLVAPTTWLAGVGLVIAAGGISMYWPLLLAHASAGRERPGAVVGAVTSVGYIGLFAGPAVIGWISNAVGLRGGLIFIAVAAAFVALAPTLERSRGPASAVADSDTPA